MVSLAVPLTQGRYHQVRLLVNMGVSLDQREQQAMRTPVMLCCLQPPSSSVLSLLKLLLARGADLSATDVDGRNALGVAVAANNVAAVRVLLSEALHLDLDLNHADGTGRTPLHLAVQVGSLPIVRLLVPALKRHRLSVDKPDASGMTPLMAACRAGLADLALVLAGAGGASLSMRDNVRFWSAEQWLERSELAVVRPDLLQASLKALRSRRCAVRKVQSEVGDEEKGVLDVLHTDFSKVNYIGPTLGALASTTGNTQLRPPLLVRVRPKVCAEESTAQKEVKEKSDVKKSSFRLKVIKKDSEINVRSSGESTSSIRNDTFRASCVKEEHSSVGQKPPAITKCASAELGLANNKDGNGQKKGEFIQRNDNVVKPTKQCSPAHVKHDAALCATKNSSVNVLCSISREGGAKKDDILPRGKKVVQIMADKQSSEEIPRNNTNTLFLRTVENPANHKVGDVRFAGKNGDRGSITKKKAVRHTTKDGAVQGRKHLMDVIARGKAPAFDTVGDRAGAVSEAGAAGVIGDGNTMRSQNDKSVDSTRGSSFLAKPDMPRRATSAKLTLAYGEGSPQLPTSRLKVIIKPKSSYHRVKDEPRDSTFTARASCAETSVGPVVASEEVKREQTSPTNFNILYSMYSAQHSSSYRKPARVSSVCLLRSTPEKHPTKSAVSSQTRSGRRLTSKKLDNIMDLMMGRKKKSSLLAAASSSGSGSKWGKLKFGAFTHTRSEPAIQVPNRFSPGKATTKRIGSLDAGLGRRAGSSEPAETANEEPKRLDATSEQTSASDQPSEQHSISAPALSPVDERQGQGRCGSVKRQTENDEVVRDESITRCESIGPLDLEDESSGMAA